MICKGILFKLVLKELSAASGETYSVRLPTVLPHSLSSALVLGALETQSWKSYDPWLWSAHGLEGETGWYTTNTAGQRTKPVPKELRHELML